MPDQPQIESDELDQIAQFGKVVAGAEMSKYSIVGESGTGFEHDDGRGPANCGNCVHMQHDGEGNGCMHPVMMAVSKLERNRENYPIVEKKDRCMFVRRPAKN